MSSILSSVAVASRLSCSGHWSVLGCRIVPLSSRFGSGRVVVVCVVLFSLGNLWLATQRYEHLGKSV